MSHEECETNVNNLLNHLHDLINSIDVTSQIRDVDDLINLIGQDKLESITNEYDQKTTDAFMEYYNLSWCKILPGLHSVKQDLIKNIIDEHITRTQDTLSYTPEKRLKLQSISMECRQKKLDDINNVFDPMILNVEGLNTKLRTLMETNAIPKLSAFPLGNTWSKTVILENNDEFHDVLCKVCNDIKEYLTPNGVEKYNAELCNLFDAETLFQQRYIFFE